jgi:hypothetical protein
MNRPLRRGRDGERPVAKRLPIILWDWRNKEKSGVHEPDTRQDGQTLAGRRAPAGRQKWGHEPILGRPASDFSRRGARPSGSTARRTPHDVPRFWIRLAAEPCRRFEGAPGGPLIDSEGERSWRGSGPSGRCTPFIRTLRETVSSGKFGRWKDGKVRQSDRDQAARAGLPRLSHRCRALESFIAGSPSTPASSRGSNQCSVIRQS